MTSLRAAGRCPAWCDRAHPNFPNHMSSGWMCFVPLASDQQLVQELEVYIQQHTREVGPRIVIGQRPTGKPAFHLLPDEAVHLGRGLIRLAAMAQDDSKLVTCEPCDRHEA